MVVEISIEEVEKEISKIIGEKVSIIIDRDYVTNDDRLEVLVKRKGQPDESVYKLTSSIGNIWKKFLIWSVADGFTRMNGMINERSN